jgi:hypothetical protein
VNLSSNLSSKSVRTLFCPLCVSVREYLRLGSFERKEIYFLQFCSMGNMKLRACYIIPPMAEDRREGKRERGQITALIPFCNQHPPFMKMELLT